MLEDYSFLRANTEDFVFSAAIMQSIPASIRKQIKVREDMTAEEVGKLAHGVYSKITVKHFQKFRKLALNSVDEYGGDRDELRQVFEDGYGFNRDGCTCYFFHLFVISGMYKAGIKAVAEKDEGFFAVAMWETFKKMAARLFPDGKYRKTLQGVMLNELSKIGRRTRCKKQDAYILQKENAKIAFMKTDKFGGVAMTTPMQKVLSMYQEELCKVIPSNPKELGKITFDELGKYSKCRITLDGYMKLTRTKDKKTARKTIETACARLFEIYFSTTVNQGREYETYKGRLFQSQFTKHYGGIYEMEFSNDYLKYCSTTTPAAFHPGMYLIDGNKYRYAWSIGEKLRWYFEINRGREQAARLGVKRLLEEVPDIPTYEEVMSSTRDVTRRIIEPVERDLDELQRLGVLKSWEYTNAKGVPLTKKQVESMDYETWSQLYITFDLDLPSQNRYIEQHQKKVAAAKKRAAARKRDS